jgi:hypothetical protein
MGDYVLDLLGLPRSCLGRILGTEKAAFLGAAFLRISRYFYESVKR